MKHPLNRFNKVAQITLHELKWEGNFDQQLFLKYYVIEFNFFVNIITISSAIEILRLSFTFVDLRTTVI